MIPARTSKSVMLPAAQVADDFSVRLADFATLADALDYAATAGTGMIFYDAAGQVTQAMSYAYIRDAARDLGGRLLGLGLRRGDRVGIVADMGGDFIQLFFACQSAGLIAVPLPVITGLGGRHGYEKQLSRVLETSGARAALGGAEILGSVRAAAAGLGVEFILTPAELAARESSSSMLQPLGPGEASHIQFSSGSTRNPHGIEISQRALLSNARSIAQDGVGFDRVERVVSWLPFYHDMGLIGCMVTAVACQYTVHYLHTDAFARRPMQWLQIISDKRGTISFSPTFGYDICARRSVGKDLSHLDLSGWRHAGIGGDMIQPDVFARFAEAFAPCGFRSEVLGASYGLAEATLAVSFAPRGRGILVDAVDKRLLADDNVALPAAPGESSGVRKIASCGAPLKGCGLQIRDAQGKVLDARRVGHVFISGPNLMTGYHGDPKATAACLGADGWLNTGDMGYLAGGELFITGRYKDIMIVNGRNIWPQDVEWHAENNVAALRSRDTAAFAIEEENGREVPVLLVQCRELSEQGREDIRKAVHAAVYRNTGIDIRIELVPQRSLPFTTSGKLIRSKARQAWLAGEYAMDEAGARAA